MTSTPATSLRTITVYRIEVFTTPDRYDTATAPETDWIPYNGAQTWKTLAGAKRALAKLIRIGNHKPNHFRIATTQQDVL